MHQFSHELPVLPLFYFSYNMYDHRRGILKKHSSIAEDFIGAECRKYV